MPRFSVVIPARYGSSRFPAKPLYMLAGKAMIARVAENALRAAQGIDDVEVCVATDHPDIASAANAAGAKAIVSKAPCATGSDRVRDACAQMEKMPEYVINLQGDAPLIGAEVIQKIIRTLLARPDADVATPIAQLSWSALDELRERKRATPFSGTTALVGGKDRLLWFSKNVVPAMRHEEKLRRESEFSPVYLHLGLYGYRREALEKFSSLPQSRYETLEELEQLRFLENGMSIVGVALSPGEWPPVCGVDTPEDAARVEEILRARKRQA
ncbi:MAG: 3-deoxy-manno-octulosonate cytidylyltransferase [Rickettsiales bacterium]